LSASEIALLREERYSLDGKGRSKTSEQFLPFPQSLLFSVRAYAKNHGAEFEPDTTHLGWSAMHCAVEVRNRVTHPKAESSLSLSEKDLQKFSDAAAWWKATMLSMFAACKEADEYWCRELETHV